MMWCSSMATTRMTVNLLKLRRMRMYYECQSDLARLMTAEAGVARRPSSTTCTSLSEAVAMCATLW
jgi:hypothetical protein